MLAKLTQRYLKAIADWILTILVHGDAFLASPRAYLVATKWWIRGKRLRAHSQFAALFSQSPRAYALWMIRSEVHFPATSAQDSSAPITALIDLRQGHRLSDLAATVESLSAEGLGIVYIGSHAVPDLISAGLAIDWANAEWLMPVEPGDLIAPGTAAAYQDMIRNGFQTLIYADDDVIDDDGHRRNPHFKPDWNGELFIHHDFLTGACILQTNNAKWNSLDDGPDWPARLTRIVLENGVTPGHLRQMLHHRRHRPAPRLPRQTTSVAAELPSLSVIVPTRNRVDLLRTCLDGVAVIDYPDFEIIVVDNDSDDPETLAYLAALDPARHRVLRHAGPFNYSEINNRAVTQARGSLVCLLNNDVETTDRAWLALMAAQALRPDVGAVGARLLYPNGRIQHAGVVIGIGDAAAHAHRFLNPQEEGYFHRHSLPQFITAVTAACLVVVRDRFLAAGSLDERNFAVAYNDVDLCLRLNQRGWQSFYEPRATLIHHESVSRGHDLDPVGAARFAGELAALKRIWKTDQIVDPYHHPNLSRVSEKFVVAL